MGGVADRYEHEQSANEAVTRRFQEAGRDYSKMSAADLRRMRSMLEGRDRSGSRGEHIDEQREVLSKAIQEAMTREQSKALSN